MNIFIIAALTADGFIAKDADHVALWTSKADKKRFVELTKKAGVMVMGRKTFETIGRALPGRHTIVYSSQKDILPGVEITSEDPKILIERLRKEGYTSVAICGGSSIYSLFMESGLVNKIYLTIEPLMFGKGVTLFNKEINASFTLTSVEKNESTLLLEYSIL
ncbi:MAG: dihydrofolate reductase FolA [Candidatus Parcubacteria bacterium]|jgi:dihydrofolate reductase